MTGGDDTIGALMQSHISNKYINDDSPLALCGYKKLHPLEEIITFTISLNTSNAIIKLNNSQRIVSIIEMFCQCCEDINIIYQKIKETFETI